MFSCWKRRLKAASRKVQLWEKFSFFQCGDCEENRHSWGGAHHRGVQSNLNSFGKWSREPGDQTSSKKVQVSKVKSDTKIPIREYFNSARITLIISHFQSEIFFHFAHAECCVCSRDWHLTTKLKLSSLGPFPCLFDRTKAEPSRLWLSLCLETWTRKQVNKH